MIDQENNTIAVIPARGGSKRFPNKNIAKLNGLPLIAYAILALKSSKKINEIFVSTDSPEIKKIAIKYGASVPFLRPKNFSGDHVIADDAIKNFLTIINTNAENIIVIQPTSPFVQTEHIDESIDLINKKKIDSVTTLSIIDHRHHPYNLSFKKNDSHFEFIFNKERSKFQTRQSKPDFYKFGNLFVTKIDIFKKKGRFGNIRAGLIIDSLYSWDIDYDWELFLAEKLIEKKIIKLNHLK